MNEDIIVDIEQSVETGELSGESNTTVGEGADSVAPLTEEEVMALSLSDTSTGTISDTYLDYFEGIVEKLSLNEHYVIWKSGDYSYTLAYGEDIEESNGRFTGECDTVEIYRDSSSSYNSNWYVQRGNDELALSIDDEFVYSDLGMYPTVERGVSALESEMLLFAVGFAVVYSIVTGFFNTVLWRIRR